MSDYVVGKICFFLFAKFLSFQTASKSIKYRLVQPSLIRIILMIKLDETKVDYFWICRYSNFALLSVLSSLPF